MVPNKRARTGQGATSASGVATPVPAPTKAAAVPPTDIPGSRGTHQQGQSGGRFKQQWRPPCPRCGNMHLGIYYIDLPICYECGLRGHIQKECRSSCQGAGRGTIQPSSSAAATSSALPPARGTPTLAGHGAARAGAPSLGGPNRFYVMSGRHSAGASPDVVICI
nr:uncharacterized protein LOC117274788 [Nicotiana tomentosiformis]